MPRTVVARSLVASRILVSGRGTATPTIPPDPDPPVDPNLPQAPILQGTPAPLSVSETSVTLTSSWNQYVNAYIEWGLTASYGSTTPEETSFDYTTHIQSISGLAAGTTYHYRWVVENSAGQQTVSADYTFTTSAAAGGGGITFTDSAMPTGAGWTDGSNSISASQSWLAGIADGTDATHHRRVVLGAGYTRVWANALSYLGRAHITFWGGGTPVHTTQPTPILGIAQVLTTGNTGGCIIRSTSVDSGLTPMKGCFGYSSTGLTYRGTDIRWDGIQFEGNGQSTPSTTLASQGNEHQAGIYLCVDGGEVVNCTFTKLKGDAMAFLNAGGSYDGTAQGDVRCRNVKVSRCWVHVVGRVGLFPGASDGVTVEDCLIEDTAYAFIDFEPDYYHMIPGAFTGRRITFMGRCNWTPTYYMPAIQIGRSTGRSPGQTWYTNGAIGFYDCVFGNTHGRNSDGTSPPTNQTSNEPWEFDDVFGPIVNTAPLSFVGCERIAYPHAAPMMRVRDAQGGVVCTGNARFLTAGSYVSNLGGSGTITSSGNTYA